jgi:hypothetical protein
MRLAILALCCLPSLFAVAAPAPVDLGSRRVLLVDDYLTESRQGIELRLHPPRRGEVVFKFDAPWEGTNNNFFRLIRFQGMFRMYYVSAQDTYDNGLKYGGRDTLACVLEGPDGIHWSRPDLGLFPFRGSKHNNIIWTQPKLDNFTPFLDTNPACPPDERFKATSAGGRPGLWGFGSADGLHWRPLSDRPIITKGRFDSENNAFWDPVRKQYWCYIRGLHDRTTGREVTVEEMRRPHPANELVRDILAATSTDFRNWTDPQPLRYIDSPDDQLYTNQVEPYYRAPDMFVGFPTRYVERELTPAALRSLPDPTHRQRRMKFNPRYGTAMTEGLFMTSRDGYTFKRWDDDFIPPGPQRSNNWIYGDGYLSLGLIETRADDPTAAPELTCYAYEGRWKEGEVVRRYTLRIDGFVSYHASDQPGKFISKPVIFSGRTLALNFATAAAGSIRVELQTPEGLPLPGHALADCDELFGDTIDRVVTWHDQADLGAFAGRPVRLRIVMHRADLYSLKFGERPDGGH